MNIGTILIVEDNEEFRKIYGDRLTFDGYNLREAGDGEEGLKVLHSTHIDLIITDINMPTMDGYAFIREVKKDENLKTIPILVMSIFDSADYVNKAKELGAEGYIIKGTQTPNDVSAKVTATLAAGKAS